MWTTEILLYNFKHNNHKRDAMKKHMRAQEQGFAPLILFVLLIIVVLGVASFAAWRVVSDHRSNNSNGNGSGTSSSSGSTATETSCLATYHDSNLCHFAAFSNAIDKTAYTATLNVTQSGQTSMMTLKADGKGNNQLNMSGNGETVNSITLNGKIYVQSGGNGTWLEYDTGAQAPVSNPTSNMNIGVGSAGITFKNLGTEACGSLTCYKYQVSDTALPGTQYVWFDTGSYKLRRWQYSNGSDSTDMSLSYNAVTITAPSPVESISQLGAGQ